MDRLVVLLPSLQTAVQSELFIGALGPGRKVAARELRFDTLTWLNPGKAVESSSLY